MRVLVTGGTGTLGSELVEQLRVRGHDPLIASRRPGSGRVVIDLATGDGLDSAVQGIDVIVHCASAPGRSARATDVEGTVNLAATNIPVLYMSIVGVDRHPFRYYQIKREGEIALAANSSRWTVLRATQFHVFVDQILSSSKSAAQKIPGNRGTAPLFLATRGFKIQPIAHQEVATKLVDLVESGPTNAVEQLAGPQPFSSEELAETWGRARGGRPVYVPTIGRVSHAFKNGLALPGEGVTTGSQTWEEFLEQVPK